MRRLLFVLFVLSLGSVAHAAPQELLPVRADGSPSDWFEDRLDHIPELIYRVPLKYPDIAREAGVGGTVLVLALVDTNGVVANARVKKSIPMLDAAALDCVRQWRFSPSLSNGHPVAIWVGLPVRFDLNAAPEEHPGPPPPLRGSARSNDSPRLPDGEPLRPAEWPAGWSRGEDGFLFAEQIALDQLPKVTRRTKVRFEGKPSAKETPRDVLVVALVRVEPDGHVSAARIVQSAPPYDAPALRTVQTWRFRPALQGGVPVAILLYVPVLVRTR